MDDATIQLEGFRAKYLPEVAHQGRLAVERLRARLPGCDALVYDNYNFMVVGFSPDGKTGHAFLSIAQAPRWATLCFLFGIDLDDPTGLLNGSGSQVRSVRLAAASDLELPAIATLVEQAIARSRTPYDPSRTGQLVIKSISTKQRPRRPD
jgi:hypothetical protein